MQTRKHRQTSSTPSPSIADLSAALSSRELQVVRLLAEGMTNQQIGDSLELSHKTVKNHVSHILRKAGLNTRTQVAILALRGGLC